MRILLIAVTVIACIWAAGKGLKLLFGDRLQLNAATRGTGALVAALFLLFLASGPGEGFRIRGSGCRRYVGPIRFLASGPGEGFRISWFAWLFVLGSAALLALFGLRIWALDAFDGRGAIAVPVRAFNGVAEGALTGGGVIAVVSGIGLIGELGIENETRCVRGRRRRHPAHPRLPASRGRAAMVWRR